MIRRLALVACVVASLLAGGAPAYAVTGSASAPPPSSASASAPAQQATLASNGPWCYVQSQNPHGSGHFPGTVDAIGISFCPVPPGPQPFMSMISTLYEWNGSAWVEDDQGSDSGAFRDLRVVTAANCEPNPTWFMLVSTLTVDYEDGSVGTGTNTNQQLVTC
jgi:hypothetical protein